MTKKILMTGMTGLIGRWTAAALTRDGNAIIAPVREAASRADELRAWINDHGGDAARVQIVEADLAMPGFLDAPALRDEMGDITHVYSFAAAMAWGLSPEHARRVNAQAVYELVSWAQEKTDLERFVHISGYLVTSPRHRHKIGFDPVAAAISAKKADRALKRLYRKLGAYEASKIEADYIVRRANHEGLPVTILNPATVIGSSLTGEAHQLYGIEGMLEGLSKGTLSAVPGQPQDWVPLIAIDFLAEFAARAPFHERQDLSDYVLLNQGTPTLKNMLAIMATQLRVRIPKRHVPVWALHALLKSGLEERLGTPAEALAFINDFRFDTSSADAMAATLGLVQPEITPTLQKSVDYWHSAISEEQSAA